MRRQRLEQEVHRDVYAQVVREFCARNEGLPPEAHAQLAETRATLHLDGAMADKIEADILAEFGYPC
jgi:hypothetical protein